MSFLNSRFCSCPTSRFKNVSEITQLKDILPVSYEYNVCDIESVEDGFVARFRVNITEKESAIKWLEEFSYSSNTTYRTDKVYRQNTVGRVYKVSKYCHHRSKISKELKKTSKNTNCSSRIVLTVKKTELYRKNEGKDVHLQDFPTSVVLRHAHNHLIEAASALQFRKPLKEVNETYLKMFKAGMTPAKAFQRFTEELQESHGEDFHIIEADRSQNPDIKWVYNLYYNMFRKEYGETSGEGMMVSLDNFIKRYNDDQGEICIKSKTHTDGNYCIVAATPLMKRIMLIPEAEEILFCDATSSVDRFGTKTFQILTNSCCGGLPVAILLTSSENEASFVECLRMFQEFIEDKAFGGRGKQGPKIIMTDDDKVEQNGFAKVFPNTEQLLCSFHILQCCWRYLCSYKSGVSLNNRQEIFFFLKKLLYAETEDDYTNIYANLFSLNSVRENPELSKYITNLNGRKDKWALYFRREKILRGQNTNNISEAAVRVLKDRILERTKAYSVVQLLDFLVSDMNNYYVRKIVSIANGRIPPYLASKYNFDEDKLTHLKVSKISMNTFEVENEITKMKYVIDLQLDLCTCFIGKTGKICKHLQKVSLLYKKDLRLCPPKNEEEKKQLLYIAMGKVNVPEQWFLPLQPSNSGKALQSNDAVSLSIMPQESEVSKEAEEIFSSGESSYPHTPVLKNAIKDFENVAKEIIETVQSDEAMLEPFQKFLKNYHNIKTKSALQSALTTFGKYSGFSYGKKMRLCSAKKIGVQPTAISRRKTKFGGRQSLQSGRPIKRARISEHGYAQEKPVKSSLMPKKCFKKKAPHSIVACTEANISLGKKH